MLLEFSIQNFRSFQKEQFLSFLPDKREEHEENVAQIDEQWRVLKTAVIYGANASGKSNFIQALHTLDLLINQSAGQKPGELLPAFHPFKFDKSNWGKPTVFKLDFLLDHIRYQYEVHLNSNEIEIERLLFYPQGREAKLFERKGQSYSYGEYFRGPKKTLEALTAPNQLFLSKGAVNNVEELVKVFTFFNETLVTTPFLEGFTNHLFTQRVAAKLFEAKEEDRFLQNFMRLICSLDTGINRFQVRKAEKSDIISGPDAHLKQLLNDRFRYGIEAEHDLFDQGKKVGVTYLPLEEESVGTQKLFTIIGLVLVALERGLILVMDEFERSLHPLISRFLIQLFQHPVINRHNAQLLIATHDTALLEEETRLRRDQIWIVEKDDFGASDLFSLSDMKGIRTGKYIAFEKWYLSGRFGGIPNIESLNVELNFAGNGQVKEEETTAD